MLILTHHINKLQKLDITKQEDEEISISNAFFAQMLCHQKVSFQAVVAFSAPSSKEEVEEGQSSVARCCEVRPSARAHQRRRWRENGAALVFGHQNVADVPLTAGQAHLRSTELWIFIYFFIFNLIWVSFFDATFTCAHAYLVPTLTNISASSGETVLQACTTLGHRHAFTVAVHRVPCVTVSGFWKSWQLFTRSCVRFRNAFSFWSALCIVVHVQTG